MTICLGIALNGFLECLLIIPVFVFPCFRIFDFTKPVRGLNGRFKSRQQPIIVCEFGAIPNSAITETRLA